MFRFTFPLLILLTFSSYIFAQQSSPTIAVFKLDTLFTEGHGEPTLDQLINMEDSKPTFMALMSQLRRAAFDKNVKACVFYGDNVGLGMAQTQELQRQIIKLRNAGKKTFYYSRSMSNSNLHAAAAVDKIVLFPEGEVLFNGVMLQGVYFKKLLDNLHLKADIIHIGDYKSAGEPFYLDGPSKESAEQTQTLLDNVTDQLKTSLKEYRKIKISKIHELVDRALFSAKDAKKEGLVDELAYHLDFVKSLKKEFGENVIFNSKYGLPKKKQLQFNNIMDIFSLFNELSSPPKVDNTDKISLTVIEGGINGLMAEPLRKHILHAAKDKTVKAMVVRVNSPGGSALASEVICQALKEFKASGKPLVVTMGNVAASGGYYVATPADIIYAENLTITGSIGVVGGKIIIGDLMDKIGISFHDYKKGKHADLMSSLKPFSPEEKTILLGAFERVYSTFKERVQEGRGNKIKGDVEKIAGGRVYTGNDALSLGLVDKIGGLRDALNETVDRANLKKYKIVMFPKEVKLMDLISNELQEKSDDEYVYSSEKPSISSLVKSEYLDKQLSILKAVNPKLEQTFKTFLLNLQLMHEEKVLLISPSFSY